MSAVVASPAEGRTLVAVFAHPDDETIVSPALAHYARQGTRVYVVIATDGRKGVAKHAGIPAGDSLAAVRAGEADPGTCRRTHAHRVPLKVNPEQAYGELVRLSREKTVLESCLGRQKSGAGARRA